MIGSQIIGGERLLLIQFLRAYRKCFAFNMKELDALIEHSIQMEFASGTPIFCRPYRYNDITRNLIRSRKLHLVEVRLVELLHDEYASATVIPTKKYVYDNYTNRQMCGDYHHIN